MTDETNNRPSKKVKFFIYGGLVLHADQLAPLTQAIETIRLRHGLGPTDSLKFDTNSRPEHVTIEQYTSAKNDVIETCHEHGIRFMAYMALHDIVKNEPEVLIGWGLNTILGVYNYTFLPEHLDTGIAVVDRLPFENDNAYLKEKFSTGLVMDKGPNKRLKNISLFASSCDGASHLSSAVDVVLGAFRYCINEDGPSTVPASLFPKVARMLYFKAEGGDRLIGERGLTMRPRSVNVPAYKAMYEAASEKIVRLAGDID